MNMTEFVTLALQDELHPKINEKEGKNMEEMRTLAFQVPDSFFQRIKDYLHRHNMTQKAFVIGLIEQELNRNLAESQETGEAQGDFEDTEQLDADQELLGDPETASSVEELDETEPSIPDQEVPEISEEGSDDEELDDEGVEETEDTLEDEGEEETEVDLEGEDEDESEIEDEDMDEDESE